MALTKGWREYHLLGMCQNKSISKMKYTFVFGILFSSNSLYSLSYLIASRKLESLLFIHFTIKWHNSALGAKDTVGAFSRDLLGLHEPLPPHPPPPLKGWANFSTYCVFSLKELPLSHCQYGNYNSEFLTAIVRESINWKTFSILGGDITWAMKEITELKQK